MLVHRKHNNLSFFAFTATPDNPSVHVSKATKTVIILKSLNPHNLEQTIARYYHEFNVNIIPNLPILHTKKLQVSFILHKPTYSL